MTTQPEKSKTHVLEALKKLGSLSTTSAKPVLTMAPYESLLNAPLLQKDKLSDFELWSLLDDLSQFVASSPTHDIHIVEEDLCLFLQEFKDSLNWSKIANYPSAQFWTQERIQIFCEKIPFSDFAKNKKVNWTSQIVRLFENRIKWNQYSSQAKFPLKITREVIADFEKYWDWSLLSLDPVVQEHPELWDEFRHRWDWSSLTRSPLILSQPELIRKYQDEVDWYALSQLMTLDLETVREFKDRLDWNALSERSDFEWPETAIEEFSGLFDFNLLSLNPLIQWSEAMLEKYKSQLNWDYLSSHPLLPWSLGFIKKYESKWNWCTINPDFDGRPPAPFLTGLLANTSINWTPELLDAFKGHWTPEALRLSVR